MGDGFMFYDEIPTGIGPLCLVGTLKEIFRIDFGSFEENEVKIRKYLDKQGHQGQIQSGTLQHPIKEELIGYFRGEIKDFTRPESLFGTAFQQEVWRALAGIPYGETITYKELAERIHRPRAVRAVGGALNKNPFSIVLPCHRVIGADGSLTGFGGGLDRKEQLLKFEQENMNLS